jgi:hypothetical protein
MPTETPEPNNSRHKAAATVQRHKKERRAESLRQIRAQTADGSLVVTQMTDAQREESRAARQAPERGQSRRPADTLPDLVD